MIQMLNEPEFGLSLDGPRILVDEMIAELDLNAGKSKQNIDYFRRRLGAWKDDAAVKKVANAEFTALLERLSSFDPEKTKPPLTHARLLQSRLDDQRLFHACVDEWRDLLLDPTPPDEAVSRRLAMLWADSTSSCSLPLGSV